MNTMRKLVESECRKTFDGKDIGITYGYETSYNRNARGLDKSHDTDAYVIAGNLEAKRCNNMYLFKQLRCHNRQIHKMNIAKGGKLLKAQQSHVLRGYRHHDIVRYESDLYDITGRREKGSFVLERLKDGVRVERTPSKLRYVRCCGKVLVYQRSKSTLMCDSPAKLKT